MSISSETWLTVLLSYTCVAGLMVGKSQQQPGRWDTLACACMQMTALGFYCLGRLAQSLRMQCCVRLCGSTPDHAHLGRYMTPEHTESSCAQLR